MGKIKQTENGKTRNGFPYHEELVTLKLETHLPTKWLAVDQETGDVWQGTPEGSWKKFHGSAEVEEDGPEPSRKGLVVSRYWACPESPVGFCEYDEENDPCCDCCVHCGDPEERK